MIRNENRKEKKKERIKDNNNIQEIYTHIALQRLLNSLRDNAKSFVRSSFEK